MLNTDLFAEKGQVIPAGFVVVGASLDAGAAPTSRLSPGDQVEYEGLSFTVELVDRRMVEHQVRHARDRVDQRGRIEVAEVGEQPAKGISPPYPWNHLQDWRDFGPVHGGSKGGVCNVLMADGSVKDFYDTNGDGYLNPGFDTSAVTNIDAVGYADSKVEMGPQEIFNGVFIAKFVNKGNLDQ
mgnify:CR=1 FL=1